MFITTTLYTAFYYTIRCYVVTNVEHKSDTELIIDKLYLALQGELWGVYCEYWEENWQCYNHKGAGNDRTWLYYMPFTGLKHQPLGTEARIFKMYTNTVMANKYLGSKYNTKMSSYQYRIMGFPILVRRDLYIESGPRFLESPAPQQPLAL